MGVCISLCLRDRERPNPESRFPILEIGQKSDSGSDPALKAKAAAASGNRDAVPLLSHRKMQLSSDSSADEERNRIAKLLQPPDDNAGLEPPLRQKTKIDSSSRTFPNVPADYNANAQSDSADEKQ
jgi:hypothetical protein